MRDESMVQIYCPVREDVYGELGAYAYARSITLAELVRRACARLIEADVTADVRELALAAQLGDMGLRSYTPRAAAQADQGGGGGPEKKKEKRRGGRGEKVIEQGRHKICRSRV